MNIILKQLTPFQLQFIFLKYFKNYDIPLCTKKMYLGNKQSRTESNKWFQFYEL